MAALHPFVLERPTTVEDAVATLAEAGAEARVMAGGQSLTPLLTLGLSLPEVVVSLDRCQDLGGIRAGSDDITIAAMVTTADLAAAHAVMTAVPLLSLAAAQVGSPHVRNFGTVVGNVCHGDPGSDLIPALLCHDAAVHLRSPGADRSMSVEAFVAGAFTTAIDDGEMAIGVSIPTPPRADARHAYRKLVKRSGDLAMATCAVRLGVDGDKIDAATVVVGGALSRARRLRTVEASLVGSPLAEAKAVARRADWAGDAEPYLIPDVVAPLEYLHQMLPRFIAATVADAATGPAA